MAESIEESKKKDDQRAIRVLDGSAPATTPAEEDAFVKLTRDAFDRLSREIDSLLE